MSTPRDVVVVGAGIVGLASALRMLERRPSLRLAVVDKELEIGRHQTGHNSGVLHRGVYYAPGSLKASLCVRGAAEMEAFCEVHGIEIRHVGKVIVALDESELPRLAELERRGIANGVPGLHVIGPERIQELEPHAAGIRALYSPRTAVVDFTAVARAMADDVRRRGGEILLGERVLTLNERRDEVVVETNGSTHHARHVVACAGLYSDRVAQMTRPAAARELIVIPFRGDYYVLRPERRFLCRGLIYPVPDPRFPFLGAHFTIRHDGDVWAGPNAVLAFRREGYGRFAISPGELASTLIFPGFWRMARRYWQTGAAEMWRDYVRPAFVRALQRYVPEVRDQDLVSGPSGVRAQAVARDGSLVDDFVVEASGRTLHVRNAPSPAATSSLAIGSLIADRAEEQFQ